MTLPGGMMVETDVTIDYAYDGLYRLIGHIFDFSSQGDPQKFKSQAFVDAFEPGCHIGSHGCADEKINSRFGEEYRNNYNPSDPGTTTYGLTSSVEDFADTFAVTILFDHTYRSLTSDTRIKMMRSILENAIIRKGNWPTDNM